MASIAAMPMFYVVFFFISLKHMGLKTWGKIVEKKQTGESNFQTPLPKSNDKSGKVYM